MHPRRRLLWIAICALAPWLPGQEASLVRSSPDTLCSKLASSDPRRVARAAAEVAANVCQEFQPQVLAALKTWSARNSDDAALVRLFLLDALLQTDAQVPAELLRPHLQGITEVPAFVLLARFPAQNQAELLAVFRARKSDDRYMRDLLWVAAGNLLSDARTPGFAALLLRDREWTLTIDVVDRDRAIGPWCGGGVEFRGGGTRLSARAGFPPVPAWSLDSATPSMEVLARARSRADLWDGVCSVSCHRELITTSGTSGPGSTNLGDRLPEMWLEGMAGGVGAAKDYFATICYTTDAEFVAHVERHRLDTLADRRRLLLALVAASALTRDEMAAIHQPLQLVVRDEREPTASPLPSIQGTLVRK
jgi:hypothetical protein